MGEKLNSLSEHEIRMNKIKEMEKVKLLPWPSFKPTTDTCKQAVDKFVADSEKEEVRALAGRLMSRREHGKTIFGNIQDRFSFRALEQFSPYLKGGFNQLFSGGIFLDDLL